MNNSLKFSTWFVPLIIHLERKLSDELTNTFAKHNYS